MQYLITAVDKHNVNNRRFMVRNNIEDTNEAVKSLESDTEVCWSIEVITRKAFNFPKFRNKV